MNANRIDVSTMGMPGAMKTPRPDPEARTFLRIFNLVAWRPLRSYTLAQVRLRWRYFALAVGRRDPVGHIDQVVIGSPSGPIKLRIYYPAGGDGRARPAFVWFHGGAFLIGEAGTTDSICRSIANTAGCAVVAVDYRLAPEHDLYAGREDGMTAIEWIFKNGPQFGIDPTSVAIGGDSAGGNLAAALAQQFGKRGLPALRLQVLIYPATNLADEPASKADNASGYLLTAEVIDWVRSVVGDNVNYRDSRLSPAYGKDFSGLAPALVVTAGFDPIRDDGLAYTQLLREAGVPVELLHYPGQFHGFINCDTVLSAARDALYRIGSALGAALADGDGRRTCPNRTLEMINARPARMPLPTFAADTITATFMAVEWFEYQRNRIFKILAPATANLVDASWLLNVAANIRGTRTVSTIEARETFGNGANHWAA